MGRRAQPEAATSVAVVFTITRTATATRVVTATASAGGSLTDGQTYFYCGGAASAHGEMKSKGGSDGCNGNEKSATPSGANLSVTLTFAAMNPKDGFRRRVYRGLVSGGTQDYDCYFELPVDSDANFIDDGAQTCTPKGANFVDDMSMVEPDADYRPSCHANWNTTTLWYSAIATTGWTENFGAAPANAEITCEIVRGY
jgi:hypothetical protein